MNRTQRQQLERLVEKHGMRELLDALAEIADAYAERGESLPWDCEIGRLDADEARTVAANLRAEMF
jgi:hypothetical protein